MISMLTQKTFSNMYAFNISDITVLLMGISTDGTPTIIWDDVHHLIENYIEICVPEFCIRHTLGARQKFGAFFALHNALHFIAVLLAKTHGYTHHPLL